MKEKMTAVFIFTLLHFASFSQMEYPVILHKQFITYHQQALQEKLFIHTDKDFYVAGDICWFKLYDVDGLLHKPLSLNKVAYVEILAAGRQPILQSKIALHRGSGNGSFIFPASMNSGNYVLRGYTSWMKNFQADYFFEKSITVVNTLKRPDWQRIVSTPVYDVQFFPEGGNLVKGLESKLAFKATDQYGKGVDCSGYIVDEENDTVASFKSHRFGMGHLPFKPTGEGKYTAIVTFNDGSALSKTLPLVYPSGYVMNMQQAGEDSIKITVTRSPAYSPDKGVYLFMHTRHSVKNVLQQEITGGQATFTVSKQLPGEGISHFTVFDERKQPVCERLYFKRPKEKLQITVKPDKNNYRTRSKVTLDIEVKNNTGRKVGADLSLSVFLLDSLQGINRGGIGTYLWLSSDLKGRIESPEYYFQDTGRAYEEALENLLLTQGWRRFKWEDIVQQKKLVFKYLPEYEGLVITGKITDKKTGTAVSGTRSFLTVPGKQFSLVSEESNIDGVVHFVLKKYFGRSEVIVQTADSNYQVNLISPYVEESGSFLLPALSLSENAKDDLLRRHLSAQTANAYYKEKSEVFLTPGQKDTTVFYGTPDTRYYLDDYTRFTTMEEVMREYVPEVRVRKQHDRFHYQVKNTPYKVYFEEDPLVLLDGIPVTANAMMAVDPLKIKKLEVVAREYFINDLVNKGIVSYTTYDETLEDLELPASAIIMEYDGLQLKREFYSPAYESKAEKESHLPDFRNTLHWAPELKPHKDGKINLPFFTSDLAGRYAVVAEGIDENGAAGTAVITFIVEE